MNNLFTVPKQNVSLPHIAFMYTANNFQTYSINASNNDYYEDCHHTINIAIYSTVAYRKVLLKSKSAKNKKKTKYLSKYLGTCKANIGSNISGDSCRAWRHFLDISH